MSESEESKQANDSRLLYDFDEATFFAKSTAVFTRNNPHEIQAQLESAFQDLDVFDKDKDWNEKKWKCTFNLRKAITDEDKQDQLPAQSCRVQAKLLKMDEERICVEFTRLDGDSMFFFESVREIKTKMV